MLINSIIALASLDPFPTEDTSNPEWILAENIINNNLFAMNSNFWWYNTLYKLLKPNASLQIPLPSSTLAIQPIKGALNYTATELENLQYYSIQDGLLAWNDTPTFDANFEVKMRIAVNKSVSQLPITAYEFLRASARKEFWINRDGEGSKLQALVQEQQLRAGLLTREHNKNTPLNIFEKDFRPILAIPPYGSES